MVKVLQTHYFPIVLFTIIHVHEVMYICCTCLVEIVYSGVCTSLLNLMLCDVMLIA